MPLYHVTLEVRCRVKARDEDQARQIAAEAAEGHADAFERSVIVVGAEARACERVEA
jgi:hypothetical protein